MTTKPDYTSPLDAAHAALIDWYKSEGNPWPPENGCDGIRATMQPATDHTPARPEPKQVASVKADGTRWYSHSELAKLAGITSERLVAHRQHPVAPIWGTRTKDPTQTGIGLRWYYKADEVEAYLKWREDTEAKREANRQARGRGKAKAGTAK